MEFKNNSEAAMKSFYEHSEEDDWIALARIPKRVKTNYKKNDQIMEQMPDTMVNTTSNFDRNVQQISHTNTVTTTNFNRNVYNEIHQNIYSPKTILLNKSGSKMILIGVQPLKNSRPYFEKVIKICDTTKKNAAIILRQIDLRRMCDILHEYEEIKIEPIPHYIDLFKYTKEELQSTNVAITKFGKTNQVYRIECIGSVVYMGLTSLKTLLNMEYFLFKLHDNINLNRYEEMIKNTLNDVSQVAVMSGFDETKIKGRALVLEHPNEEESYFRIETVYNFWNYFYETVKYEFQEKDEVDGREH